MVIKSDKVGGWVIDGVEHSSRLEYDIVETTNRQDMIELMVARLSDGWRAIGSISVVYGDGQFYYCQAMERVFYVPVDSENVTNA